MSYKKFTIQNFRCFSDEQILCFSIPVQGKVGSGISYIVGENNSGKTTLIEGLWINENQKIKSSEKKSNQGPVFCLYDTNDEIARKVSLLRPESYTLVENPKISKSNLFEVIASRR